jgi:hypothetical protein
MTPPASVPWISERPQPIGQRADRRQMVADWRHIEAPLGEGDLGRSPAQRSFVAYVARPPDIVTLP